MQRRILASLLQRIGCTVEEAATGDEALARCAEGGISLVVSDWMMPSMNGLEFCRRLRAMGLERYVYFILLTSKSDKAEIAEGLDAGADDFLTKPVDGVELRARIHAGQRILTMQKELQNALGELQGLYDALDRDLIEARKLQQSLIRNPVERFGVSEARFFLKSSGRVGGDLVGHYPIATDRIALYSIDVSGHGIASALLAARIAGYLSTAPEQNIGLVRQGGSYSALPPDEVVTRLNDLILAEIETEHYFTIALAEVDLSNGVLNLCQAGHPYPAIHRADGTVEYLGSGGLPVGLIEGATYSAVEAHLAPADRLFLYSDGITECTNAQGSMFDEEGLTALLRNAAAGDGFFPALISELDRFAGTADLADDVSGVLFDFEPEP